MLIIRRCSAWCRRPIANPASRSEHRRQQIGRRGTTGDESRPLPVEVGVGHGVDQAADRGDDRDRSVPHRLHLGEPARLESARHEEHVAAGEHAGATAISSYPSTNANEFGMLVGEMVEVVGEPRVARAEDREPHRDLLEQCTSGASRSMPFWWVRRVTTVASGTSSTAKPSRSSSARRFGVTTGQRGRDRTSASMSVSVAGFHTSVSMPLRMPDDVVAAQSAAARRARSRPPEW